MKQGVVSPEVLMNIHVHMHKLNAEMFSHHQSQAGFKEILNEQTWMEVYVAGSWNHATLQDAKSLTTDDSYSTIDISEYDFITAKSSIKLNSIFFFIRCITLSFVCIQYQ